MKAKPVVIDGPRMSDISEPGETRFLVELQDRLLAQGSSVLGVHLWTHSPKRLRQSPALLEAIRRFRERGVPVALQVTITGLGGTLLEPGVETTAEALAHVREILDEELLDPGKICLRIDPLQVWRHRGGLIGNLEAIPTILEQAAALGIKRARISIMTFQRYQRKILPRMVRLGLEHLAVDPTEAASYLRPWFGKGMQIATCATDLGREGIPAAACFDFTWLTGLPLPLSPDALPVAKRTGCLCFYPREVSLVKIPRRSSCSGRCVACYAQEHV